MDTNICKTIAVILLTFCSGLAVYVHLIIMIKLVSCKKRLKQIKKEMKQIEEEISSY